MKIQGLTEKINQTLNNINYLEEEQQKYQELGQKVNQFLTKYGASNFTQLSNGIKGLLSDRKKYQDERDQARAEITNKDDRIAQLEKLFKGTAQIFSKQHNYVDQLKERLEQEKQNQGLSQEQIDHLQTDIKRLDEEKKELTERIEELRIKEEFLKEFRDKELADLKQEVKELSEEKQKQIQKITQLEAQLNQVLSPEDKANWSYLVKSKLTFFACSIIKDEELDQWERELTIIQTKMDEMNLSENELFLDYVSMAYQTARLILNWIEQKKLLRDYQQEIKRLQGAGPIIEEVD